MVILLLLADPISSKIKEGANWNPKKRVLLKLRSIVKKGGVYLDASMVGLVGEVEMRVKEEHTALRVGSGGVEVFATPMLVALMEMAAIEALKEVPDLLTVGAIVNIKHLAPTPVGMRVRAKAELVEVNLPKLLFSVEAFDEQEKIGEGQHMRFSIHREKFMRKAEKKAKGPKGEET